MRIIARFMLIASCLAVALNASVQAEEAKSTVEVKPLRGPLHLLHGRGGNVVASVGLDGVLLVDNDYAELGPAYEQVLSQLTNSKIAPGFVINTHWHADHTGNNEFWGYRGAVMVAHHNVRQRLSTPQEIAAMNMKVEPSAAIALPIITFRDSMALHFNGDDIEIQHYPKGHTDGDSVIFYSKQNVVHTGDLFFKDAFPFVDLSSGGSVAGYIANVESVLARMDDETIVVPGHGAIANKADFARYLKMLKQTNAVVHTMLIKGMSAEQIVAQGLGRKWASWGKGFISEEQWINTIVSSR